MMVVKKFLKVSLGLIAVTASFASYAVVDSVVLCDNSASKVCQRNSWPSIDMTNTNVSGVLDTNWSVSLAKSANVKLFKDSSEDYLVADLLPFENLASLSSKVAQDVNSFNGQAVVIQSHNLKTKDGSNVILAKYHTKEGSLFHSTKASTELWAYIPVSMTAATIDNKDKSVVTDNFVVTIKIVTTDANVDKRLEFLNLFVKQFSINTASENPQEQISNAIEQARDQEKALRNNSLKHPQKSVLI